MKRELQCTWTFWQDQWQQQNAAPNTKRYLAHLGDALNVKDFYILLNRHTLATVPMQSSLHIFRKHVKPEWEDSHNINGGHLRFYANVQPNETEEVAHKRLSCLWFDVLRSVIGEHMAHSSSVVGVGYTAKPLHPILSIWISTTDPQTTIAVRNAALQLFVAPANTSVLSLFTARFYTHKTLASGDGGFRLDEVTWHRRIRSAPEPHVTIGDEEEDMGVDASSLSATAQQLCGNSMSSLNAVSSSSSLINRRGLNLPSPIRDHHRSRTASCAAEAIVGEPIKPVQPSSLAAPSPVKDWSTAFTPSYISVSAPPPMVFPLSDVPQPPKGLDVSTPSAGQAKQTDPSRSSAPGPRHVHNSNKGEPPLPIAATPTQGKQGAPTVPRVREAVPSDRLAFVFEGIVYPPKMNRKVYRAIVFNQNPDGNVVPGTFAAPQGVADGTITTEQYDEWKLAASA